jgi:hypothetical protein
MDKDKKDPIMESLSNKTKTYCTFKKKTKGETEQPENYCITSMNLGKKTFPLITLLMGIMEDEVDKERKLYEKLYKTGYKKIMGLKGDTYESYIENEKKELDYKYEGEIKKKISKIPEEYRLQLIGRILGVKTIEELKQLNNILNMMNGKEFPDKLWYTKGKTVIEAHKELKNITEKAHLEERAKNVTQRKAVAEVMKGGSFRNTKNIKGLYMKKTHKRRNKRGGATQGSPTTVQGSGQGSATQVSATPEPIKPVSASTGQVSATPEPGQESGPNPATEQKPWWSKFTFGLLGGGSRRKLKRRKQTKRR